MDMGYPPEGIRVLFFISDLGGGGAEKSMVNLLSYISRNKTLIKPLLVLLSPPDDSPYKDLLPQDTEVIVIGRASDSSFRKVHQFVRFLGTVRKYRPQVIYSMLTQKNLMSILAGHICRTKVIASEHNILSEIIKTRDAGRILWFRVATLVKILYRHADKILAISDGVKADLIERFNVPADRIQVIYNLIDIDKIKELSAEEPGHPFFQGQAPVVLGIGRMVPQKAFDTLLRAFKMVLQKMDARLIILGEGAERYIYEKLADDLGIGGNVSFPGFRQNPYAFLSRAHAFVLSSRFEGMPTVLLEALACGAPVVSTDCRSGPREILLGGRCGLLVPVGDEHALSEGILRVLGNERLRGELSVSARERALDFSIDRIFKQYESAIREVANGNR